MDDVRIDEPGSVFDEFKLMRDVRTEVASVEAFGRFCDLRQTAWLWRDQDVPQARHRGSDPIIAAHHFTNVYRELDPGTVLARELLEPYDLHFLGSDVPRSATELWHEALWTAVAYRMTNRASTWRRYREHRADEYPSMEHEDDWLRFVDDELAAGRKVFTGRHLTVGRERYGETLQGVRHLERRFMPDMFESAERLTAELQTLRGVGRFFAWQVTADLMMSGHVPPAPDHVLLGPGARFALRFMLDRRPWSTVFNAAGRRVVAVGSVSLGEDAARAAILDLRANQGRWLPSTFQRWTGKPLDLVDLEHALCEYGRWGVLHARLAMKTAVPA